MEPTNEQRAGWAREAIDGFLSAQRVDRCARDNGPDDIATDLMTDIGHWLMTHEDWTPDDVIKVFDRAKFAFEMERG